MSEKKKPQVAWLSGGYHSRRARLRSIRERFNGFEQAEIDGEMSVGYLIQKLRDGGCFDPKRLIIVHAMPQFKGVKKKNVDDIIKALSRMNDDCFVVFNGLDKIKDKALFEFSQKNGKVYDFETKFERKQAEFYIEDRLESMGMKAESGVAEMLIENCAYDAAVGGLGADQLEMALQRLILYVAPEKQVRVVDVEATMYSFDNFVIWDLVNALDVRDYGRCMKMLSQAHLVDPNIPAAVTQMMTTLLWRYRLILLLRESVSNGASQQEAIQHATEVYKLTKTGTGLSARMTSEPYKTGDKAGEPQSVWTHNVARNCCEGMYGKTASLDLWSRRDIYRLILVLQEAMALLRGTSENESLMIADMVFMKACNLLPDKQVEQVIKAFERTKIA
tara:strand:- start:11458 stop:12627 length:1170 start_codon:yes stop_codon:yes gene_type:complete